MFEIELYKRATHETFKSELKEFERQFQLAKEESNDALDFVSIQRGIFFDAISGKPIAYGRINQSHEDIHKRLWLKKNKQYQWLFVEVYEEFEDFLENIYAYLGYRNIGYWPLEDFGQTTVNELKQKDFQWFRQRVEKKKNIPNSIIQQLENVLPDLKKSRQNNRKGIDLYLLLQLLQKFRHVIVHRGGIIGDRSKFISKVLNDSGLSNNGKPKPEYQELISYYFGSKEEENLIVFLEYQIPDHPFLHQDILGGLFQIVLSYGYLVYQETKKIQP
jgi:hypothetical protein